MPRRTIHPSFEKLAQAEQAFLGQQFLAPVLKGEQVQVSIAGVRCAMKVDPRDAEGWGVFQPIDHSRAQWVRPAKMKERAAYLALFPKVRLVICQLDGSQALTVPTDRKQARLNLNGLIPVSLVQDAELFSTIVARFDGARFWFDEIDSRVDAGNSNYLRQASVQLVETEKLDRPGLSAAERLAYALVYEDSAESRAVNRRRSIQERLRDALKHAGARLEDFAELDHGFRVQYEVDGESFNSVVNKSDLSIRSAGICLSGEDANFDLSSLVGVLREGADGRLLRMNY